MGFLSGGLGAIAGAVGGVASTLLGNNSAKHEAERNRDWQENMSNTSVQRRIADLKSAGLNPLLAVSSASSGASTPSGAQADIKHFDFKSVIDAYLTFKQGKVAEAEERRINADAQRIEDDNTLFKYKQAEKQLDLQLKALNINGEKLRHDLLKIQTQNGKIDYLIGTLKAKGIKIDNQQAGIALKFMQRDFGLIGNSPTAKNYEYITGQVGRFTDWVRSLADLIPGVDISTTNSSTRGGNTYSTTTHSRRYFN